MKNKTLFVIAGEASGDQLAAPILQSLLDTKRWRAVGIGGPKVRATGMETIHNAESMNLIGLFEVIPALPKVWKIWKDTLASAKHLRPDAALLIDMPDFNMRLGPKLAKLGAKVVYVGAPQAWAWRPGRASTMAPWVHTLGCLFPFEVAFFQAAGVNARFVGHPRAEQARQIKQQFSNYPPPPPGPQDPQTLVIMPGSRPTELRHHLPVLREAIPQILKKYPNLEIKIPVARTLKLSDIADALPPSAALSILPHTDALPLLASASLAAIASGTASTEAMLMGTPAVVFYKVSPPTYALLKHLIRVPWIAMPNILGNQSILQELIQSEFTPERLVSSLSHLLANPPLRAQLQQHLLHLASSLEAPSPFAQTIAAHIDAITSPPP